MVPCLRIERAGEQGTEVEWMYESLDIMRPRGPSGESVTKTATNN